MGTGCGAEDGGGFASEDGEGRIAGRGPGDPVDGVLKDGRVGAVVLGRGDDEGVGAAGEFLEAQGGSREAVFGFEVGVVEGEREIAEVGEGGVSAYVLKDFYDLAGELAMDRLGSGAACED